MNSDSDNCRMGATATLGPETDVPVNSHRKGGNFMNQDAPTAVFLATFAGIWTHTAGDSAILASLSKSGYNVEVLTCNGYIAGMCNVMQSRKRSPELVSSRVDCRDCIYTSKLITSPLNAKGIRRFPLDQYLSQEDNQRIFEIVRQGKKLGNPFELEVEGIAVGRYAAYQKILDQKLVELRVEHYNEVEFETSVSNFLKSYFAAKTYFMRFTREVALVVRNAQYVENHAIALAAERLGHRVIYIDSSRNYAEANSHIVAWNWSVFRSENPTVLEFNPRSVHLKGPNKFRHAQKHLRTLRSSNTYRVYSSAATKRTSGEIRKKLGILQGHKVILAALSSTDEPIAALAVESNPIRKYPGAVFASQIHWIKALMKWVEGQPNVHLVVRVHPREFPSSRNPKESEMARIWSELMLKAPEKVTFNLPSDSLSLYDLFRISDIVTTGWSSAGLEASLFGVRSIAYDRSLLGYPASAIVAGASRDDYFRNLTDALLEVSDQTVAREAAWKWLEWSSIYGTVYVGGRIFESYRYLFPRWLNLAMEGLDRYLYFVYRPLDLLVGKLRKNESQRLLPLIAGEAVSLSQGITRGS